MVLGLGGTQGTTLCTKAMRASPYGVPKIMVSTMASGNVARWVDTKDITMTFSVADILGLNLLRERVWPTPRRPPGRGPRQISLKPQEKPLVAVTTVGITTDGAMPAIEFWRPPAMIQSPSTPSVPAGGRWRSRCRRA